MHRSQLAPSRMTIERESALQDDVRAMVAALNNYLRPLSPREFQFQLTVEQMEDDSTTLFVMRNADGAAIGMGALKLHGAQLGEVKRMFIYEQARGTGAGHAILDMIEGEAHRLGLHRLVLETGSTPGFEAAWRVYERAGFTECGAVLDYPDSGYNRFYEKTIRA